MSNVTSIVFSGTGTLELPGHTKSVYMPIAGSVTGLTITATTPTTATATITRNGDIAKASIFTLELDRELSAHTEARRGSISFEPGDRLGVNCESDTKASYTAVLWITCE